MFARSGDVATGIRLRNPQGYPRRDIRNVTNFEDQYFAAAKTHVAVINSPVPNERVAETYGWSGGEKRKKRHILLWLRTLGPLVCAMGAPGIP